MYEKATEVTILDNQQYAPSKTGEINENDHVYYYIDWIVASDTKSIRKLVCCQTDWHVV